MNANNAFQRSTEIICDPGALSFSGSYTSACFMVLSFTIYEHTIIVT